MKFSHLFVPSRGSLEVINVTGARGELRWAEDFLRICKSLNFEPVYLCPSILSYHVNQSSLWQCSSTLFWYRFSLCCSGWLWTHDSTASASPVAGITDSYLCPCFTNAITKVRKLGNKHIFLPSKKTVQVYNVDSLGAAKSWDSTVV